MFKALNDLAPDYLYVYSERSTSGYLVLWDSTNKGTFTKCPFTKRTTTYKGAIAIEVQPRNLRQVKSLNRFKHLLLNKYTTHGIHGKQV